MEVKPGYKRTEIGVLPEDWEVELLGNLFCFNGGFTASRDQLGNIGHCYLHYGDIHTSTKSYIDVDKQHIDIPKLTINLSDIPRKYILHHGDVVFVDASEDIEGSSKYQVILNQRGIPFISGLHTIVAKDKKNNRLTNNYKRHCFQTYSIKNQFRFYVVGTKVSGISKANISKILIPIPPQAEQEAIAEALNDVVALIESLEQLIVKKCQIKQGAIQNLLLPKGGWVERRLSDIAEIRDGTHQTPKYVPSGVPFFSVENVTSGDFVNTKFISENEHRFLTQSFRIEKGDILMTRIGSIGDCKLIDWDVDASFYVSLALLKIRKEYSAAFICQYSQTAPFKKELELNSLQSAIPKKINLGQIANIRVKLPINLNEQIAIAAILFDIDAEILALETKLKKARQIKQGMMHNLLTGKIRLISQVSNIIPFSKAKKSKDDSTKTHNWEFNEAVVISVLVKYFGSEQFPLGRKRYTKFLYFLHRYAEGQAEGFLKKAAGPYNPKTRYGGPEEIAQENGYIYYQEQGQYTGFVAGNAIAKAEKYFSKWYGKEVLNWLEQFRRKKNDELELLSTVDMAMKELRQAKRTVDVKAVKSIIQNSTEWKAKLKRDIFSDANIAYAIKFVENYLPEQKGVLA